MSENASLRLKMERADLVDALADAMQDVHDMDTGFNDFAEAAVDYLEKNWREVREIIPAGPHAPCSHCGKPWNTTGCAVGGCPIGADL